MCDKVFQKAGLSMVCAVMSKASIKFYKNAKISHMLSELSYCLVSSHLLTYDSQLYLLVFQNPSQSNYFIQFCLLNFFLQKYCSVVGSWYGAFIKELCNINLASMRL